MRGADGEAGPGAGQEGSNTVKGIRETAHLGLQHNTTLSHGKFTSFRPIIKR